MTQEFFDESVDAQNIVQGQRIVGDKLARAKELRRQTTGAEKILWQHLRANRLNRMHFRRQQVIDGFIVDFYCHAAKLVIEVDGKIHQQQLKYDQERDRVLTARGLRILRMRNDEVMRDLKRALARIAEACET